MKFLSVEKTVAWVGAREGLLDEQGLPRVRPAGYQWCRLDSSNVPAHRLHVFVGAVVDALGSWEQALLWVTDARLWGGENLHAYYRCRESYGDRSLVRDAPGHLAFGYEKADVLTFTEYVIVNNWTAYLFPLHDYGLIRISANNYIEIGLQNGDGQMALRETLERMRVDVLSQDDRVDPDLARG